MNPCRWVETRGEEVQICGHISGYGGLMVAASAEATPGFAHCALILDSDHSVRQILAPVVRQALATADGVLVAVRERTAGLLRGELDPAETGRLQWADNRDFYQRLGFAYESFRRVLAAAHAAGRRIHVFAEPEMAAGEWAVDRAEAYLGYEAICNETFAGYGCEVTCLWDSRRQSARTIESVRRLHHYELRPGGRRLTTDYISPLDYLARRNELPLPLPAGGDWDLTATGLGALPSLRGRLQDWASRHGFTPSAAADVVLAVAEIATNGVLHGRPPVRVYGWHHDDTLVVQVDDHGAVPLSAAAGYWPPPGGIDDHCGLWVARQLADVLQTHTTDTTTSVRLYFPRELTNGDQPWPGPASQSS